MEFKGREKGGEERCCESSLREKSTGVSKKEEEEDLGWKMPRQRSE